MDFLSSNLINETSIDRILNHHGKDGFVVISSNRSAIDSENDNLSLRDKYEDYLSSSGLKDTEKEMNNFISHRNNEADDALHKILKNCPYSFTKVYGGYKGKDGVTDYYEPSYIIYNKMKGSGVSEDFEKLKDFALEIGRKFNQAEVYIQEPNSTPSYYDSFSGEKTANGSDKFKINRPQEEFFTTGSRDKKNTSRFTADLEWLEENSGRVGIFENMAYLKPGSISERMRMSKSGEIFLDV